MASRRMHQENCDPAHCPIEVALEVIGGMWKVIVVRELLAGTKRYSELHRGLGHVTHKMLAQQLRQLERDGVVDRKVYPQVPPKVEYSLTPLGRELGPLLDSMSYWGLRITNRRARAASRPQPEPAASPAPPTGRTPTARRPTRTAAAPPRR
ncbi:MAG: helix-turn-helix domain-containing protein [Vicinamibacteraceae bacterium]